MYEYKFYRGMRRPPPRGRSNLHWPQEHAHSSKAVAAICPDLALSLVLFLFPSPEANWAEVVEEDVLRVIPHPLSHHMRLKPIGEGGRALTSI